MNNNPYLYQPNVQRIDNQIKELENLKNQFQTMPQQQPMNVFNVGNTPQIEFEARFVKDNEEVENIPITRRTAFISPKNKYLKIKELNGDIETYELIPPKDEKDLKIDELTQNNTLLENKLKEMEKMINGLTISNGSTNEVKKPTSNDTKSSKK